MTLVHINIIKGTTRTVYTDSLMGSSKAMFIKMPLLVNIGAKVHVKRLAFILSFSDISFFASLILSLSRLPYKVSFSPPA